MSRLRLYRYMETREVFVLAPEGDVAAAEARGRLAIEDGWVHLSHDGATLATDAEGVVDGTVPVLAVMPPPELRDLTIRQWAERAAGGGR